MKKIFSVFIAIICLSFVVPGIVSAQTPKQVVTVLKGLDPVELVNGKEVQEQEILSVIGIAESFNGKAVTSPITSIESITVNTSLDAKLFQKP